VSREIYIGSFRLDPALSGFVVVRHSGQVRLPSGGQLIACMPYLVLWRMLWLTRHHLTPKIGQGS
jgi:hypothetical protein